MKKMRRLFLRARIVQVVIFYDRVHNASPNQLLHRRLGVIGT